MWLRLYDDLPDDEKFDGFTDQQKWLWVVLMCMASRAPVRGTLRLTLNVALPVESITKRTQMSPEAIAEALQGFAEREMLHQEDGVWVLTHWDKRQHESDNSGKRTQQYRKRKQQSGDGDVTSQDRHSDVTVTPSDTDSDTEYNTPPTPSERGKNKPDYADEFAEWWSVYLHPPRDEKGRALRNYIALRNKGTTHERLLTSARNYAATRRGEDAQYHKKAANFLGRDGAWTEWETSQPATRAPQAALPPEDDVTRMLRELRREKASEPQPEAVR